MPRDAAEDCKNMGVTVTFLGHSAVHIDDGDKKIIIDPFLTGNPSASATPDQLQADMVLLTHDHADHVGDTEHFLKQGATFVGIFELAEHYAGKGYTAEGMNIGGSIEVDGVTLHMTHALHTCHTGHCVGFIVETKDRQIYHAGDTGLSMDLRLLKEFFNIDVAFLPIGDRFTMGPESAARAAEWIGAQRVVPIHYGTWPLIPGDPKRFAQLVGDQAAVLKPGESLTI